MQADSVVSCSRGRSLIELYPGMRFSAVFLADADPAGFGVAVKRFAKGVARGLGQPAAAVEECLVAYEKFFAGHRQEFPLRKQLATAAKRGFPPVPPPVLALLALEAATGVLMGVQNADAIEDYLLLDVLGHEESFVGMRGDSIRCAPGEIVVRDGSGIIASLFQGPDRRTAVTPDSRNLVFYVFDTEPSLGEQHGRATDMVANLVADPAIGRTTVVQAE